MTISFKDAGNLQSILFDFWAGARKAPDAAAVLGASVVGAIWAVYSWSNTIDQFTTRHIEFIS